MKICSENDRRVCGAEAGMPHIWEIGFPSADPSADGAVIRHAHAVVDRAAARAPAYWRQLRAATHKPIWLMGYYHDLVEQGAWQPLAREGLVDALVVPDCPEPRRRDLLLEAALHVDVLGFVRPEMPQAEINAVLGQYPLVYVQLYSGKTGMSEAPDLSVQMARRACGRGGARTFAGFGVRTPEKVRRLLPLGFTGAVISTETIRQLDLSAGHLARYLQAIGP